MQKYALSVIYGICAMQPKGVVPMVDCSHESHGPRFGVGPKPTPNHLYCSGHPIYIGICAMQ